MSKGSDRIRLAGGRVTTIAEGLDDGTLVLKRCDDWYGRGGRRVTAYFVDEAADPDGGGWRITPGLYRSRMGLAVV